MKYFWSEYWSLLKIVLGIVFFIVAPIFFGVMLLYYATVFGAIALGLFLVFGLPLAIVWITEYA